MKLPDSWHKSPLGELFKKIVVGYVGNVNDHYCDASRGVPFYRTLNIRDGYFRHDEIRHVTKEFNDKNKKSQIENDDIVIARVGANLGMVCKVSGLNGMANMANAIIIKKKSAKNASSDFYTYFLLSPYGKSQIYAGAAGGAQGVFNTKLTQEISVPVPPLPEQKKIAKILSTWDKAITTTEQLLANSQQQKKALMQQLLTGKKRLLDSNDVRFSGEWRFITFDDVFKVNNKKSAQVKSSDYLEAGAVPVVDQGKQLIVGYCNNEERYTDIPVIVFGDHTRCLKWVDFDFCPGADGTQVLDTKAGIDKKFGYYSLCFTDIPNLGYSRHMRELKEKDFKVPLDANEQQKIAAVLSTADQEITTLQQKLDALKQEKQALMQQLLTGKRRVKVEEAA
ncbi:restriction endonuclease subunit S [Aeromonas caviae]|uniref:restriction endonuclease subunit S n=1 Tax=Aeromonas caviae TaxID=648 RepID=UPI00388F4B33